MIYVHTPVIWRGFAVLESDDPSSDDPSTDICHLHVSPRVYCGVQAKILRLLGVSPLPAEAFRRRLVDPRTSPGRQKKIDAGLYAAHQVQR